MLWAIDQQQVSSALGVLSICSWLTAQSPQLYENYRLGSAEGLALPFLVSWFFGDLTNLIGCVLTRQLPFQTYLATYFVIVDIGLLSQFTYYSWKNPAPKLPPFIHSHRHSHLPSRSGSRVATKRKAKRTRTHSGDHHYSNRKAVDPNAGGYTSEDPMERSWMSESSSTAHSPASTRPNTRPSTVYNGQSRQPSLPSNSSSSQPPTPINSTHSESRGRTLTRPVATRPSFFGPPLETISGSPASGSPAGILATHSIVGGRPVGGGGGARNPGSTSTSRTRPARKSTSMVFLSVGLLFSFGRWSNVGEASLSVRESGVVWSTSGKGIVEAVPSIFDKIRHPFISATSHVDPITVQKRSMITKDEPDEGDPDYPYPKRDFERFIGRSSAWLCTSLYLTSRLPQIWQNFRRRSVEGLSMLLFIMAFVGNSFYVASILSNPLMSSPGYLLETTPYLLGSGGTLCFDITIVMQSLLYSEKREERRRRRILNKHSVGAEEAAALLHEGLGTDDEDDDTGTLNGRRAGQVASRSGSRMGRSPAGSRRPISHQRSESTELAARAKKRWSSSPSSPYHSADEGGGILSDQEFDFESSSVYKGKAVSRPTTLSGHEIEAIMEEGESSVTLR